MPAKPRTKASKKRSLNQRLLRWVFSPLPLCALAALAAGWVFWPQVEERLPTLEGREEYRISAADVHMTPPPRWIPEDIVEDAFDRAGIDEDLSILDPKLCERLAFAFYTHPWVEQLKQVRKYPRVYVDLVYRRPVAMVEVAGGSHYPIDRLGHLLPRKDFSPADVDRYPVITQISTPPLGNLGEAWGDPAVHGAAELAGVLTRPNEAGQSWWQVLGLHSIIAPPRTGAHDQIDDMVYRIATRGGSEILWGRYPATEHPGELKVAAKLERMADYHYRKGFDRAPTPFQIDIRHWNGVEVRELATANSRSDLR